jgi:hypothetical protein
MTNVMAKNPAYTCLAAALGVGDRTNRGNAANQMDEFLPFVDLGTCMGGAYDQNTGVCTIVSLPHGIATLF